MIEFEEFDDDVNAHKKPLPPTIWENETLGFISRLIVLGGKLIQLRFECFCLFWGCKTQINVWFEFEDWEIETVESVFMIGRINERKKNKEINKCLWWKAIEIIVKRIEWFHFMVCERECDLWRGIHKKRFFNEKNLKAK
jgi:hypothetical protein